MILNYGFGALVFSLPGLMFKGSKDACLAQTNDLKALKYQMVNFIITLILIGSVAYLTLFKVITNFSVKLPHIWLEVKLL